MLNTPTIVQTKLYPPPLPDDMVLRPRLSELLDRGRLQPLTLVSAPAGYGKSTLISAWLESADCPTAWISLDERDNELIDFLLYFLAAILSMFPDSVQESQALLMVAPLPPVPTITRILINELDQIEQPFILVLDDYHLIEAQIIHDLVNGLLLHPPRSLHLVMGTRMDPFLSLVSLRARHRLVEIRSQDLRFTTQETQQFFQKTMGIKADEATIISMEKQTEGWITGLRLATLAMQHRVGRNAIQGNISSQNQYVADYLLKEILEKQAAILSDCMLKTSILDRFCADLFEVVCFLDAEPSDSHLTDSNFSGEKFLEWLQAFNLFVIPLDDKHAWFRYHHLFQEFLRQELTHRLNPGEIKRLHAAAGGWFDQNGWIEEALTHLLAAGDSIAAIEVVAKHRYHMLNTTQWLRLERWLKLFSSATIETSAELWMLKTWLVYYQGKFSELPALLRHLTDLLASQPNQHANNRLIDEISSLRSLIAYFTGDAEGAIFQARKSLERLDPELWIVRVMVRMYLSASLLLSGDAHGWYHVLYGAFEEEKVQNKLFKATLLNTICNIHWITAELDSMAQAANQCIALSKEADYRQMLGYGYYHLGRVCYQQNELAMAEELFTSVVARPYQNYGVCYAHSACGLGLTFQAMGREAEAWQIIETAVSFLLETGNTTLLPFALALQAELALRQGRLPAASQWAEKIDPAPPFLPMYGFIAPHLTLVKVWLAQNTPASQRQAAELLSRLGEYLERTCNTRFLIETLALQALLDQSLKNQQAGQAALEKALRLAQPGGFIRIFVDLGPEMARVLTKLRVDRDLLAYIEQILSAFPDSQQVVASTDREEIPESLTNRELQILELLRERMTNKEIAAKLMISPGTVKGHTIRIYQKLDVKGRRQAVKKAISLDILPTQ